MCYNFFIFKLNNYILSVYYVGEQNIISESNNKLIELSRLADVNLLFYSAIINYSK